MTTMQHRLPTKFAKTTEALSKYRNVKVEVDGHRFSSKLEGAEYVNLKIYERKGWISGLRLQPRYNLVVNDIKVCAYVGDFELSDIEGIYGPPGLVTLDTKGFLTPEFKLKAKLFRAVMGRDIVLVRKK